MTTCDPGASEVFTHGAARRPRATALRASNPAASITEGFDVLVHEVMAAITIAPWPGSGIAGSARADARMPKPPSCASRGNRARKSSPTACNESRSCGSPRSCQGRHDVGQVDRDRRVVMRLGPCGPRATAHWHGNTLPPARRAHRCVRSCADSRSSRSSTGKKPMVAPYSGAMLAIVARSGTPSSATAGPKNSTNLPVTPCARKRCVTSSTRSVVVVPGGSAPARRTPTTSGNAMSVG